MREKIFRGCAGIVCALLVWAAPRMMTGVESLFDPTEWLMPVGSALMFVVFLLYAVGGERRANQVLVPVLRTTGRLRSISQRLESAADRKLREHVVYPGGLDEGESVEPISPPSNRGASAQTPEV